MDAARTAPPDRTASPRPALRAYLLLTLAALVWGGNAVAGRLAVGQVSPMAVVCFRWLFVVIAVGPLVWRSVPAALPVYRQRWLYITAMGALGFTVFNALFYWAAHNTSAINIGVIQGIIPALVILAGVAVYRTPVSRLQAIGCAVTLAGILVVGSRGDPDVVHTLAFNAGDLAMVVATVLYAGYTVALRSRPPIEPLVLFAAIACAAFVTSLPFVAWEVATGGYQAPTPVGWALIVFIAVGPSLVAQIMWLRGIDLIGPSRAGLFMNLVPVFAALGGVAIGERFAAYHAVGLAFVIGGIVLAERRPAPVAAVQPSGVQP